MPANNMQDVTVWNDNKRRQGTLCLRCGQEMDALTVNNQLIAYFCKNQAVKRKRGQVGSCEMFGLLTRAWRENQ